MHFLKASEDTILGLKIYFVFLITSNSEQNEEEILAFSPFLGENQGTTPRRQYAVYVEKGLDMDLSC